jgi:hypothetical protein
MSKQIFCDRCGEDITFIKKEEFKIHAGYETVYGAWLVDYIPHKIDLCPSCLRKFNEWIEGEEK